MNVGSIAVCTERNTTGECVLECFLSATLGFLQCNGGKLGEAENSNVISSLIE